MPGYEVFELPIFKTKFLMSPFLLPPNSTTAWELAAAKWDEEFGILRMNVRLDIEMVGFRAARVLLCCMAFSEQYFYSDHHM